MKKRFLLLAMLLGSAYMSWGATDSGEDNNIAVYFPQEAKPGRAFSNFFANPENLENYSFSLGNSLFEAKFKKTATSLTFEGCEAMNLKPSPELFAISLGSGGTVVKSSQMTLGDVTVIDLNADPQATVASERLQGLAVKAVYTYGEDIQVTWQAILRDGSHYLRTNLDIKNTGSTNIDMYDITPMMYTVDVAKAGSTPARSGDSRLRGPLLVSDKIFSGVETPTAFNTVEQSTLEAWTPTAWTSDFFSWTPGYATPQEIIDLNPAWYNTTNTYGKRGYVYFSQDEGHTVTFTFTGGSHKLNIVGVDLVDPNTDEVLYSDYHYGKTGNSHTNNVYTLKAVSDNNQTTVPAGLYVMRLFVTTRADDSANETIASTGNITISGTYESPTVSNNLVSTTNERAVYSDGNVSQKIGDATIYGQWVRDTDLEPGTTWNVSTVIGLIAPGQARRSFLCYSERERAVPWRPMNNYNTWFELNINRNNDQYYATNMNVDQCVDVVSQWKKNLYDKYGVSPQAFVMDDGWDHYGDWTFSPNFPDGFTPIDNITSQMGSGIGAWLGPVGGYGGSATYRRAMWGGSMQLNNKAYYETFLRAISNMVSSKSEGGYGYDFRFFKFDGIGNGAQATVYGPNNNENVEGILSIERYARTVRPDIFINSTVGTWASPFWFHFTDAIWKQDQDFGQSGNSTNLREKWITYRDKWVYDYFVQGAPLCPINTLMTHGFLLTTHHNTPGSWNRDYASVLRELRCAYACGSGMVELYADYDLLNTIENGKLWGDIADCMLWQQRNSDVLPDIHWVGGSPFDGTQENVYGWAAWNGMNNKAVLTLRNGSDSQKQFTFTLRQVLDIPSYVQDSHTLQFHKAFADQAALEGMSEDTNLDISTSITVTLPANSVYIFDGATTTQAKEAITTAEGILNRQVYSIQCADTRVRGVMQSSTAGSLEKSMTVDPTQAAQQWAIVASKKYEDTYYIVNVATGKFLTTNNDATLTDAAADNTRFKLSNTGSGSGTHPWNLWDYAKSKRLNIGSNGIVMKTPGYASNDAGNQYEIARVCGVGFDIVKAEASIYAYEYGVSNLADLDNDKLYNLVNARGVAYYNSASADYLCGSNVVSTTADATNETQQIAILKSAQGNYYFYCPSAKKFLYWDGRNIKLSDTPKSTDASLEATAGINGYTWVIRPQGSTYVMAMSTAGTKGIYGNNTPSDEGDYWKITPATTWNSQAVLDLIDQYENSPATNQFYRLRGAYSYKYAQGKNVEKTEGETRLSMSDDKSVSSLFYLNADNKLVCYSDGFYVNNTCEKSTTPGTGNTFTISPRGLADANRMRTEAVKITNGSTLLSDNGRYSTPCVDKQTTDAKQNNWYIEQVDTLPFVFKAAGLGYATFCAPVSVKIPEGVSAYVSSIKDNIITLYKIENIQDAQGDAVIPANTAVLLYKSGIAADTQVDLVITTSDAEITGNGFYGTTAAESMETGNTYYSLRAWKADGEAEASKVGFFSKTTGALTGFKGWIKDNSTQARTFTIYFDGDDATGIAEALGLDHQNVEIYDLSGRKLRNTRKGLNIINGHKVIY